MQPGEKEGVVHGQQTNKVQQVAGANSSMALDADQDHVTIFYETCMLCREQQQTCEVGRLGASAVVTVGRYFYQL